MLEKFGPWKERKEFWSFKRECFQSIRGLPTWASTVSRATCLRYVLLPLILGPVMMSTLVPSERNVSFWSALFEHSRLPLCLSLPPQFQFYCISAAYAKKYSG